MAAVQKPTTNRVIAALDNLKQKGSVDKVIWLNGVREAPSLALDPQYQKTFKGYYFSSPKPSSFYAAYFSLLASVASDRAGTLESCLLRMYAATKQKHLSFCSKLMTTVSDDFVIYDRNVAALLGISTKPFSSQDWLEEAIARYAKLLERVDEFATSAEGKNAVTMFDQKFEHARYLPLRRKIDFILWAAYEKAP